MSPVHFLRNPLEWLRQIDALGVTHTGGPNFAYDLCVRRAREADLSGLSLATWRLAFNGAEPVRPRTLTAFAERFAANGFRPESFLPCYGLAEATLIVTGRHFSPDDGLDADGRVDCGPVIDGHELAVADPDTGVPAGDGRAGEIWVRGPSVSRGYWNDTGAPGGELFGTLGEHRYLRTGDLGYLRGGHLFVTGRRKDVLIQNGVNHHAHDVEWAAVADHPAVRPAAAAFTVERAHGEEFVLAVELSRHGDEHDPEELAADLRARVQLAMGVRLDTILLCPAGSIPRTTSGKIQRRLAAARYAAGELPGRAVGRAAEPGPAAGPAHEPIERLLCGIFAAVCEVPECAPTQALSGIGGDSVRGAEIAAVTEDALALPVPIEAVLSAQSPRELATRLLASWEGDGVTGADVLDRVSALAAGRGGSRG